MLAGRSPNDRLLCSVGPDSRAIAAAKRQDRSVRGARVDRPLNHHRHPVLVRAQGVTPEQASICLVERLERPICLIERMKAQDEVDDPIVDLRKVSIADVLHYLRAIAGAQEVADSIGRPDERDALFHREDIRQGTRKAARVTIAPQPFAICGPPHLKPAVARAHVDLTALHQQRGNRRRGRDALGPEDVPILFAQSLERGAILERHQAGEKLPVGSAVHTASQVFAPEELPVSSSFGQHTAIRRLDIDHLVRQNERRRRSDARAPRKRNADHLLLQNWPGPTHHRKQHTDQE